MTDQRARAKQITREICSGLGTVDLSAAAKDILIQHIECALADERRRVMEDMLGHLSELAKALPVQHEQPNLGQCTYNWYRHVEKLLRDYAKAHAGQEG